MINFQPIHLKSVWYYGGAVVYLLVTSSANWTDEDGNYYLAGELRDKRQPHQLFAGVVAGADLLFENVSLAPTTTSPDQPRTRLSIVIFDENMKWRLLLVDGWRLPDDLNPLTFENWAVQNAACGVCLDDTRFYNRAQTDFQIQEAIDGIVLANMPTATGLALMVDGVVVVNQALVTAFTRVQVNSMSAGVRGALLVDIDEIVAGVSFTIRSVDPGDNGYIAWSITEP